MIGKVLRRRFSRSLVKKKYAFVGPLNVNVPPNLVYLTNLEKGTEELLTRFSINELITVRDYADKETADGDKLTSFLKVKENLQSFRDSLTEEQRNRVKRTGQQSKINHLFLSTEKHIAFDKNLHKLILDSTWSEIKKHNIDLVQHDQLLEERDSVLGTISKLDFYQFNQGYFRGKICRLEGKKIVKVRKMVDMHAFDVESHLIGNMNKKIEYLQSRISDLKDSSVQDQKKQFQSELDELKRQTKT